MKPGHPIVISYLVCPDCGNTFPIPRRTNQLRKQNHKKTVYCPWCRQKKNMVEIRSCDAYKNLNGDLVCNRE